MTAIRAFCRRHAALAMLVLALALCVRALIPAGYMAGSSPRGITIELCSSGGEKTMTLVLPGTVKEHGGKAQAEAPCSFGALGQGGLAATDPLLLAIAIAFVMALGLRPIARRPEQSVDYLRPPLRAPPHA